jgi:3-deoxy-D-manno-octulosonic-acid transferase
MQNFADIAEKFVQRQGALRVKDSAELERAVGELLADPARRAEMGTAALAVVRENLGGIDRTVDVILQNVDTSELYVKSA